MTYNTKYLISLFNDESFRAVAEAMGFTWDSVKNDAEQMRYFVETIETVQTHGFEGGVNGFIYYAETSKFFDDHNETISDYLEGNDCAEMVLEGAKDHLDAVDILTCSQYFKNHVVWAFAEFVLNGVDLAELVFCEE